MIQPDFRVNGFVIVTTFDLGMVSITRPGILVAENVKTLKVGRDGDNIQEVYDKAVAEAGAFRA